MIMSISTEMMARHKSITYCVETVEYPLGMVKFCPWKAVEWVLPWSRLEAFSFAHEEESERIEFFFPHHHVIAIGMCLRATIEDIRVFKVRCVRDLPESLYPSFEPKEPFIKRLEVRLLNEQKHRPADGIPF